MKHGLFLFMYYAMGCLGLSIVACESSRDAWEEDESIEEEDESEDAKIKCTPGEEKRCKCDDGTKGTKVCAKNGKKWKDCQCETEDESSSDDYADGDADSDTDTDTDSDTDTDTDSDMDSDTDSSSETDTEDDSDTDTEEDSDSSDSEDDPCGPDAQPVSGTASNGSYGFTDFQTSGQNELVRLTTTMLVPNEPNPKSDTLFLWPGLEPLSAPILNFGVLQPVLTWGSSCAPNGGTSTPNTWWISALYVKLPAHCEGGQIMKVNPGDVLDIEMVLEGTNWTQTITNRSNGETVDYTKNMNGQKQQWALFEIEIPSGNRSRPSEDTIFTNTVLEFKSSEPQACVPHSKGPTDYFSPLRVSSDGKRCCIPKIILRAQGVPASSPNEP